MGQGLHMALFSADPLNPDLTLTPSQHGLGEEGKAKKEMGLPIYSSRLSKNDRPVPVHLINKKQPTDETGTQVGPPRIVRSYKAYRIVSCIA